MRISSSLAAAAAVLVGAACATTAMNAATATAVLQTPTGAPAGVANLEQTAAGVRVRIDVVGLEPGLHGVHVHTTGRCDGSTEFSSAGGHFNPGGREHGLNNPRGPHAGDLPNMTVAADGTGTLEVTTERFTIDAGEPTLFDADGAAIVVHATADDLASDPAGDAGARVACGVVRS